MPACPECATLFAQGQRYCLACGARVVAEPRWPVAPAVPMTQPPAFSGGGLPAPRAVAATVMVMLGFGTLVGAGVGSAAPDAPAPVRVVLAAPPPPAATVAPAVALPPSANVLVEAPAPEPAAEPERQPPAAAQPPAAEPSPKPATKPAPERRPKPEAKLPAFDRVFVLWMAGRPPEQTFAEGSYLGGELRAQGALLEQYHAIAHGSPANGIALLSGQGPNPDTAAGCPERTPFQGRPPRRRDGQAVGRGCVFGAGVPTILDGARWRAYVQDLPAPCDPAGRNPLAAFEWLLRGCTDEIVGLDRLDADLAHTEGETRFAFVAPSACDAGVEGACPAGEPSGTARADAFVRAWAPKILASPAFGEKGLLAIVFDAGVATGPQADFAACCDQPRGPNEPEPVDPQAPPEGGGRVGALLVSPLLKAGSTSTEPVNHYGFARILADVLGTRPVGYAARAPRADIFDAVTDRSPRPRRKR